MGRWFDRTGSDHQPPHGWFGLGRVMLVIGSLANPFLLSGIRASLRETFASLQLGRGVAWADINNDGLPDLVVSHILDPVALSLNQTRDHGHWIGLRLVGTRSNRNGLNAKVLITVEGAVRSYELVAGGGYLSSSDLRLLVGLGQVDQLDQVVVRWPSGQEDNLHSLAVDRYHVLRETR